MSHTPGPWVIIPAEGYDSDDPDFEGAFIRPASIEGANGDPVCTFGSEDGSGHLFENESDRRLIAAAPDLLEALKAILRHGELANIDKGGPHWSGGKKPPTMDAWAIPRHLVTPLEAAIAKAEGKS